MAGEKEELLNQEITDYEEKLKVLAGKFQELAGVNCSFGTCVFDPEMKDAEQKLAEMQKRTKILGEVMESLEKCEVE